jgi:hypothetical protein
MGLPSPAPDSKLNQGGAGLKRGAPQLVSLRGSVRASGGRGMAVLVPLLGSFASTTERLSPTNFPTQELRNYGLSFPKTPPEAHEIRVLPSHASGSK